jgi:hypothetical protein
MGRQTDSEDKGSGGEKYPSLRAVSTSSLRAVGEAIQKTQYAGLLRASPRNDDSHHVIARHEVPKQSRKKQYTGLLPASFLAVRNDRKGEARKDDSHHVIAREARAKQSMKNNRLLRYRSQ